MRLRNIPGSREIIDNHTWCISEPEKQKGCWNRVFKNDSPIHIEIGMGKGQFLTTLARQNPCVNYIGIEKYSSVLLRALQRMETEPLENIRFLCEDAETLCDVFAEGEIDRIYLNFSDPWPKDRHAKRRLTSRQFFHRYHQFLKKDGTVEFKTDNAALFQFSLEEITNAQWILDASTCDLHQDAQMNRDNIMTEYEERFSSKGNPIYKLIASR